jgi:uncharacterized protein YggT (Ycf19 family)
MERDQGPVKERRAALPQPLKVMGIVDVILNFAGLLLWVNWVMMTASPTTGTPLTLLGTLRPAERSLWRQGYFLALLPLLLTVRAWLYWEIAGATSWTPMLNLGVTAISFRCDLFQRALLFSVLSFGAALGLFYLWLLLLSMLNGRPSPPDPFGRFVRRMLGPVARLGVGLRLLLPLAGSMGLWLSLSFLLTRIGLLPEPESMLHRVEQGLLVGLGACLTWSHLLAGILLLYLVHSYVHLGGHPLWDFVSSLARTFLAPFRRLPLQLGKVDFAPVVALGGVYLVARGGQHLLTSLYMKLPL